MENNKPMFIDDYPVVALFRQFPELNIRQVAQSMGISEKLLQHYVNGRKYPSPERMQEIEAFLHQLGKKLQEVKL
ncbi:MAG: helix-turn-helix transcriptional regulator [Tidjanibacter sp.]|nr:helix-turn-helix transcriptional regulator [Tidjanibacter sp.]